MKITRADKIKFLLKQYNQANPNEPKLILSKLHEKLGLNRYVFNNYVYYDKYSDKYNQSIIKQIADFFDVDPLFLADESDISDKLATMEATIFVLERQLDIEYGDIIFKNAGFQCEDISVGDKLLFSKKRIPEKGDIVILIGNEDGSSAGYTIAKVVYDKAVTTKNKLKYISMDGNILVSKNYLLAGVLTTIVKKK